MTPEALRGKPVPVSLNPREKPHGPNWTGTWALGDRRPLTRTASSMKFGICVKVEMDFQKAVSD